MKESKELAEKLRIEINTLNANEEKILQRSRENDQKIRDLQMSLNTMHMKVDTITREKQQLEKKTNKLLE